MSSIKVTNLQHASAASPNIVLDSSGNATMAGTMAMATPFAMRNKIINGAMEIDQRNAGASVTPTDGSYTLDRYLFRVSQASKLTAQQSSVAPAGFKNSMLVTSSAATSVGASDFFAIEQRIEGNNVVDLSLGSASAKIFTLSFWVRSSLTGTFGGSFANGAFDRTYPFTYSISAANTWEYKTVTITGDTSGTWLTSNGVGLRVQFGLGVGSNFSGSAGSWQGITAWSATGATSVVGTNGATFYLTGVQLEVGSVATPFERRMNELQLCQRYYEKDDIAASGTPKISSGGLAQGITHYLCMFKVTKRTTPSVALAYIANIDNSTSAVAVANIASGSFRGYNTISNGSFYYADAWVTYAASAEL
jgi:hypothetical protein